MNKIDYFKKIILYNVDVILLCQENSLVDFPCIVIKDYKRGLHLVFFLP
jgi:hypothetical protein